MSVSWRWLVMVILVNGIVWGIVFTIIINALGAHAVRPMNELYEPVGQVESEAQALADLYGGSRVILGYTQEGRPLYAYVWGEGATFMFDGLIHGPEDCGSQAGLLFLRWALPENLSVRLVFVPVINKDRPTSRNNARGVNLNRNFPNGWVAMPDDGYNYAGLIPASESETQAIMASFQRFDPRIFFDVHCGMEVITGGGNTSLSAHLFDALYKQPSHALVQAAYTPHFSSSCGTGGYAKAGACDGNTSSWLLELSDWDSLPDTKEEYAANLGPHFLSFYKAAALSLVPLNPSPGNRTSPSLNHTVVPPFNLSVSGNGSRNHTRFEPPRFEPPARVVHARQRIPLEALGFRSWVLLMGGQYFEGGFGI